MGNCVLSLPWNSSDPHQKEKKAYLEVFGFSKMVINDKFKLYIKTKADLRVHCGHLYIAAYVNGKKPRCFFFLKLVL